MYIQQPSSFTKGMIPQQLLHAINKALAPHEVHFSDLQKKQYNCYICQQKKPSPQIFLQSKCSKYYHFYCLKKHFQQNAKCPNCKTIKCITKQQVRYLDLAKDFYLQHKRQMDIVPMHLIGKIFHNKSNIGLMWDIKQVMRWIVLDKYDQNQHHRIPKDKKKSIFMKTAKDPVLIQAIIISCDRNSYYSTKLYQHFDYLCLLQKIAPNIFTQFQNSRQLITDTKLVNSLVHLIYLSKDNSFLKLFNAYNLAKIASDAKKGLCPVLSQLIYSIFTNKINILDQNKQSQVILYKFLYQEMENYYDKYFQGSRQPSMMSFSQDKSMLKSEIIYNNNVPYETKSIKWSSITVNKDVPFQLMQLNGWLRYPVQQEKTQGIVIRVYGGATKKKINNKILQGPFTSQCYTELDDILVEFGYGVAYLNLSDHVLNNLSQKCISIKLLNQLQSDILQFIRHLKKNQLFIQNQMLKKKIFIFGCQFGGLLASHISANKNISQGLIQGYIIWNGLLSLNQHDTWANQQFDKYIDPAIQADFLSGKVLLLQSGQDWNVSPKVAADFIAKTVRNNSISLYPYLFRSQLLNDDQIDSPIKLYKQNKNQKHMHKIILKFLQNPQNLLKPSQKKLKMKIMKDYGNICIQPQSPIGKSINLSEYLQGMIRIFYQNAPQTTNQPLLNCYYKYKIITTIILISENIWQYPISQNIKKQAKRLFTISNIYNRKKFGQIDFQIKFMNQLCEERLLIWQKLLESGEPIYLPIEQIKKILESKNSQYLVNKYLIINALAKTLIDNHWFQMNKQQHSFVALKIKPNADQYYKLQNQAKNDKKKY